MNKSLFICLLSGRRHCCVLKTKADQIWIFSNLCWWQIALKSFSLEFSVIIHLCYYWNSWFFCSQFLQACKNLFILQKTKVTSHILLVTNLNQIVWIAQHNSTVSYFFTWSSACSLCENIWGGGHKLPSLPWQWADLVNCLLHPSPKYTSNNHKHQLLKVCILQPCLIPFYSLLYAMEDLLNVDRAPQSYWLWGVLGCTAQDTMSCLFKQKKRKK